MKRRASCALALLACCHFAAAQQPRRDTVKVYDLEEVTVMGNRAREVIPAQVMNQTQVKRLNALSVADAIRYFSGVQLKDYGGVAGLKTINIRSMGTNHMGVFYNGIQLGNAQNGQVDLGKYSLDNIEEIALYHGQKSNVFQSAREFGSAGTIYLQTRTPTFDGKPHNLRVALRSGSFELVNPSILMEQQIDDNLSASFSGEWMSASGRYKFRYRRLDILGEVAYDTVARRKNGDLNSTRLEASLDGRLRANDAQFGKWKIHAYNYNSERGVPGAIVNNVWRNGERIWDVNSFLQGSFEMRVSKRFSARVNAKYAADRTHYVNNDYRLVTIDNLYKQKEVYASSANMFTLSDNWEASAAYDFQWNRLEANLQNFPFPTRWSHWVSAAASYNGPLFKLQASLLGTFIREAVERFTPAPDKNEFTPALFISCKIPGLESLRLQAFYKKIFRMPTFNDLYYTDMGNADLKPEYALQYNVGAAYAREFSGGLRVEAEANTYYNKVTDKIIAYPKGQQFRWTMLNLGKVEIKGVDASLMNSLAARELLVNLKVQYTYQEARDLTSPSDTYYGDQIPYIPWHSGSVVGGVDWRGWSFNYSFIYVGERYNQQENIRYNHTQPWYTNDLSVAKSYAWRKNVFKFSCEVNNLLNQDYDVILNYPMPLRNYRALISITL
jgi:outer membrane cobalamin receptor